MRNRMLIKCWGKNCPNGGSTHIMGEDTLRVGRKAYCSVCRDQVEGGVQGSPTVLPVDDIDYNEVQRQLVKRGMSF